MTAAQYSEAACRSLWCPAWWDLRTSSATYGRRICCPCTAYPVYTRARFLSGPLLSAIFDGPANCNDNSNTKCPTHLCVIRIMPCSIHHTTDCKSSSSGQSLRPLVVLALHAYCAFGAR